jgi:Methane oxygenase PmoA
MKLATICNLAFAAMICVNQQGLAQSSSSSSIPLSEIIDPCSATSERVEFVKHTDRITFSIQGQTIAEYVFQDEKIWRPYFANIRSATGIQLSRNQPPKPDEDATDHETMHPGVWLAFGDINGSDFWRNQAKMEHLRFAEDPFHDDHGVKFASESRLIDSKGVYIGLIENDIRITPTESGWMLVWNSVFQATNVELVFGDQEEMGFGVRVATPIIEKNGGKITNSFGQVSAKSTWGQPGDWSDYSGEIEGSPVGITVMSSPKNFRGSWWHNRDYGLIVANPFGRQSMQQGDKSAVTVRRGETLRLSFGMSVHDKPDYDPKSAYKSFVRACQE